MTSGESNPEPQSTDEQVEMRIFMAGDVALTGLRDAAKFLGVHENTLRRYADKGLVPIFKLPSGIRRYPIEGLKKVRDEMYSEVEENE